VTARELRLRGAIDILRAEKFRAETELGREREIVRQAVGEKYRPLFGHCGYCGSPTAGTVCSNCRPAHDNYLEYLAGVA
jgi:hypothetical protein